MSTNKNEDGQSDTVDPGVEIPIGEIAPSFFFLLSLQFFFIFQVPWAL